MKAWSSHRGRTAHRSPLVSRFLSLCRTGPTQLLHALGLADQPTAPHQLLNRLAWLGTLLLTALSTTLFVVWRTAGFFIGDQPIAWFFGWGILQTAVGLYGHPMVMLQLSCAGAGVAVAVAIVTGGFRSARIWARWLSALVGMAVIPAAVPLLLVIGVTLFNLVLWVLIVTLCALVLMLWVPIVFLRALRR